MLENLLKELGERNFKVSWQCEITTNSIIVRMEKTIDRRRYKLEQRVEFCDLYSGPSVLFEFNMTMLLRRMARKLDEMKGENDGDK